MKKLFIVLLASSNLAFAATQINANATVDIGFSPKDGSEQLVIKAINSAQKSIHIAAYSFTSKPIAQALYIAYKKGVAVKVVADQKSNSGHYTATTYLANHGVPVKLDGNYTIFHNKFMIIDGKTIETGSFNYSAAAAHKNAENVLVLWNVPQIAQRYEEQWDSYWQEATTLAAKY
ncbi:MAG: phospholipase D family protein [Burkholderiales bacterium]